MKKVALAVFFALAVMASAPAQTYFVGPAGNDQASGKAPGAAFKTILRAVQALNHGDSIVLAPGTYKESVLFAERYSADASEMAIIGDESGKLTGSAPGKVVITPADVTNTALRFYRFNNLRLTGLTFQGPGQGMKIERSRNITVERCSFANLTRGLIADSTTGLRVESSVFTQCTISAFFQRSLSIRIAHVDIAGSSSVGALILSCGEGTIRNSIFANNNTNMIADDLSAAAWSSDYNVIDGTNGKWGQIPAVANIYEWFSASGQERHSVYVVPEFANPDAFDLHISPDVSWGGGLPGMNVGKPLAPAVALDRDGKPFRARNNSVCTGAYDYPDPRPANGWKKLNANLSTDQPRQSAGIYREDGTLVRTLLADAAGVTELWWDGLDDIGKPVNGGRYQVRAVNHNVRVVDDGAIGDDGNPMGAFNCDNADQVEALPDGSFVITTIYDEAGYPLRRYSASGQPVFASNLAEKDFAALASPKNSPEAGSILYGVIGKSNAIKLVKIALPGNRIKMADGAENYPIGKADENITGATGLAVVGNNAYVALSGLDVVRVIDLATGSKKADIAVPMVADIAADDNGTLWAISGTDMAQLADGKIAKRFPAGLATPRYIAASPTRVAVVDRLEEKLTVFDAANGKAIRTLGGKRRPGAWEPVSGDLLLNPRDVDFLPNGQIVLTEHLRTRIIWPETGKVSRDILSNFMDVAVPHPTQPQYVYCGPGCFRVDPKTGAWEWIVEAPQGTIGGNDEKRSAYLGSPSTSVVLDGRPFLVYYTAGTLTMLDVSDPLKPRKALTYTGRPLSGWAYATIAFSKDGDLIAGGNYTLQFDRVNYLGLDQQNNPKYDFANIVSIGEGEDTSARNMKSIAALASDDCTGDIYYLAVTDLYNKMVPGWGADGTGVGRSAADGKPLWFALSSGGNYMSISEVNDGTPQQPGNAWIMAGKSFGGQIDLFNADGLRLSTGNWSWPTNYTIGFVDLRFGVNAYIRPDGKPGAYVEDDAIGRFARCRIDGAETLRPFSTEINWAPTGAAGGTAPTAQAIQGDGLQKQIVIPKVNNLPINGDWSAWAKAGVVPQVVTLPAVGYNRNVPGDLWQAFDEGTAIGAIAHDGKNFYVYFVVADDTMHFDADQPGLMWEYDSIELWMEEEQFGLGFTSNGKPGVFKYRFHNRAGKQWAAGYALDQTNVWGSKIDDLARHPLGRQLASIIGTSYEGQEGYVVCGKIPFEEVKLVGGIAGRQGKEILDMTGKSGEVLRIGISFGGISEWGREQDFKVNWPSAMMFSDPTRSTPFVLGE